MFQFELLNKKAVVVKCSSRSNFFKQFPILKIRGPADAFIGSFIDCVTFVSGSFVEINLSRLKKTKGRSQNWCKLVPTG